MKTQACWRKNSSISIVIRLFICAFAVNITIVSYAVASHHYTETQMSALANRIGKTFWIQQTDGRTPNFSSTPDSDGRPLGAHAGDSFEIVDLVGRGNKNPYYKVRFNSGKEAYLRPEIFLEELNLTFLTIDPSADKKIKAATIAEEEKKRVDWIQAQPWSAAVKKAALDGDVVPGMNRDEVKKIAGAPIRVNKLQRRGATPEEHWFYPDGKQLIFHQGLLNRTVSKDDDNTSSKHP